MRKPIRRITLRPLVLVCRLKYLCLFAFLGLWINLIHAQSADCGHPDPTKFDQVFACMSSLHFGAQGQGANVFVQSGITSCNAAAHQYASALRKSRVSPQEIPQLIPSCDFLAKGMDQLKGTPPAWSACTGYPGHFDPAHMKACLDRFLPGYYGGRRSLESLNGCADATQQYELALRDATIVTTDRSMTATLPQGYQKPDCAVVAGMIGKGSTCLNYAPNAAHVQQCLGADAIRLPDCSVMRQAYETKLRQAYGGSFPPGYVALTCDQLGDLVGQAKAAQAQIRAQQAARQQQMAAEAQRRRNEARNLGGLGGLGAGLVGGGLIGWVWGFLGAPFLWGLIVHGAVVIASLLYASHMARAGRWIHVASILSGVFTRVFSLTMMGVHAALIGIGIALMGWQWAVGAVLAIVLGKAVSVVMWMFGMFRNPPVAVGKVDKTGTVVQKPEPTPSKDPHRTGDWLDPTRTDDWQ